jgi:hypothetical protein
MRLLIVNLLVFAMLAMPLHASVLRGPCACLDDTPPTVQSVSPIATGCCAPKAEQSSDEAPADDKSRQVPSCPPGNCPASCCMSTIPPVFVPESALRWTIQHTLVRTAPTAMESDLTQPHLLRLKRPPRIV